MNKKFKTLSQNLNCSKVSQNTLVTFRYYLIYLLGFFFEIIYLLRFNPIYFEFKIVHIVYLYQLSLSAEVHKVILLYYTTNNHQSKDETIKKRKS